MIYTPFIWAMFSLMALILRITVALLLLVLGLFYKPPGARRMREKSRGLNARA